MFVFTLLLVALAAANSIYLFTRFRTYDMQMRSVRVLVFSLSRFLPLSLSPRSRTCPLFPY
jgi:hypothetical protein